MRTLHTPTVAEFRERRLRSGRSQADMAEFLGLHANSIKNFESGRTQCSPQVYGFMCYRLAERNQEIKEQISEHCRRWRSRAYRNEWRSKAREQFGE